MGMLMDENGKPEVAIIIGVVVGFIAVLTSIVVIFIWGDTEYSIQLVVTIIGFATATIGGLLAALNSNKALVQGKHNSAKIDVMQESVNGKLSEAIAAQTRATRAEVQLEAAKDATNVARTSAATAAQVAIEKAREEIKAAEKRAYDEAYAKGVADAHLGKAKLEIHGTLPPDPGPQTIMVVRTADLEAAEAVDKLGKTK